MVAQRTYAYAIKSIYYIQTNQKYVIYYTNIAYTIY